jgi:hypothetical protein
MSLLEKLVTGMVAIGVIVAIGTHSQQLGSFAVQASNATAGGIRTVERG